MSISSVAWLKCGNCGVDSTDETIDDFSCECECCHHDFCSDCIDIINKDKTKRCPDCIESCETKCHQGLSDCNCSDDESEDEHICPLCDKDTTNDVIDMKLCLTCDTKIGCAECTTSWTKAETSYCSEHEDDYETSDEE